MIADVSARLYPALESRLVNAYLSSKGWNAGTEVEAMTWSHPDYPDQISFHPDGPITPDLARQLASLERRPELSVLAELRHADADLLRIVPVGAGSDTLLLEQGNRLLRGVQRLLTAAARTAMEPMPSLVGKKPREVTAYLRTLKLGMAEPGAYTLTVLSPLRDADQESLARQTILKLARTLHELQSSVGRILADSDMRRSLVTSGLSAELCDALALMLGGSARKSDGNEPASRSLTLQFVWSPLLLPPTGTISSLTFEPDLAENIKALADLLRETVPQEGFQLQGTISDLKRAHHAGTGKVIVQNITGEQPDKVSLELDEDLYTLAIQAHQLQSPVLCIGALTKRGKAYELLNASLAPIETLTAAD